MHVITVTNQKGGVGKTTTVLNLVAGLKRRGYRVLAVDLDPQQGNLTQTVGADKLQQSMFEVLTEGLPIVDAIQHTECCDIATATVDMVSVETVLSTNGGIARERKLRNALKRLDKENLYDVVIVDTPPALDLLVTNALTAADSVVVAVEADINSMHGMKQLDAIVKAIKDNYNESLEYAGILITKFNGRTNNGKDMREIAMKIGNTMGTRVFDTCIRNGVAVPEAARNSVDVFSWSPDSGPAQDYEKLTDEIISILNLEKFGRE